MKKTKSTIMTAALLSAALAMQSNLGGTVKIPAADAENAMAGVYGPPPSSPSPEVTQPFVPSPSPVYGPPWVFESPDVTEPTEISSPVVTEDSEVQTPEVTEPTEEPESVMTEPVPEETPVPVYGAPTAVPVPVYGAPVATGDLDSDGRVSIADFAVLKSYLNGDNDYYFYHDAADLNMDGSLTEEDLKMFERYLFGVSSNLTDKIEEPASPSPSDEPEPHGTVYGPPPASPSVKPSVYGTVYGPPPAYYAPAKSVPSEKPDTDEKTEGQH